MSRRDIATSRIATANEGSSSPKHPLRYYVYFADVWCYYYQIPEKSTGRGKYVTSYYAAFFFSLAYSFIFVCLPVYAIRAPPLSIPIMKLLLALCVTSILALPIQSTFTHDTSTSLLSSSTKGPSSEEKPPEESKPPADKSYLNGKKYGTFLGEARQPNQEEKHQVPPSSSSQRFITSLDKANTAQSILSEFDIEPDTSQGRLYGTFPDETNDLIPTEKHSDAPASQLREESCNHFQYIAVYFNQAQLVDLLESHRLECLTLAIILLFPLAYLVLELIERVVKRFTCEEFPWRGRNRVRLTGPERQFRAWSNQRREISADEKSTDNKI